MHIFYEEVYHHVEDKEDSTSVDPWSDVVKKLSWKNQADWFPFYSKMEITNDTEVAKKASAWFRVTYQWAHNQMKQKPDQKKNKRNRKRKSRRAKNQQQQPSQNQQRSQPLLSFAWIVYPILMKIYDEKQKTADEQKSKEKK